MPPERSGSAIFREPWPDTDVCLKDEANSQEFYVRQKKKPIARKPTAHTDADPQPRNKRRNSWEPQVIVPHQVDLPLDKGHRDEVVVPAAPNGRSLVNGRL